MAYTKHCAFVTFPDAMLLLAFGLLFASGSACEASDKPSPEQVAQLLDRLTKAKAELYKGNASADETLTITDEAANSKPVYASTRTAKICVENCSFQSRNEIPGNRQGVEFYCVNDRYYFELAIKPDQADWVLSKFAMRDAGFEMIRVSSLKSNNFRQSLIEPSVDLWSVPTFAGNTRFDFANLTKAPGFDPLSLDMDENSATFAFHFIPVPPSGPVARNVVKFDLTRFGMMVSCDISVKSKTDDSTYTMSLHRSVTHKGDGKFDVETVTINKSFGTRPDTHTKSVCKSRLTYGDVAPNEFRLSRFGLPEPLGVTWEKPTPVYVWLLAAAGGFGVLALLFRWLFRRRQVAQIAG